MAKFICGGGMQIQVKCGCSGFECPEWAIVELQGIVEPQPSAGDLPGLEIGRLCCSSQGSYTFTVGYHELSGKRVNLKKPLLVLKKKQIDRDRDPNEHLSSSSSPSENELEVIGIIRHKILFKDRPKALISRPQTKEKKFHS